ncbi:MAG: hypothetical protein Q9220_005427 [cf. Caloplaca sp. 1 TL-2023]
MYRKSVLLVSLLSCLAIANPIPADVNVPITDAEWSALAEGGLQRRGDATINQPISAAEWANLDAGGLTPDSKKRDTLIKRDKVMNCGHLINGKGGSGGHGKWIPVSQFATVTEKFCSTYAGTDIYKGHETSDTYPITLSNQGDDSQPGPAGIIRTGSYIVDHDTCVRAMKGPLGNNAVKSKRGDDVLLLSKRDYCYGSDHKDYEGGYYEVTTIGAFGSEVYAAS